MLLMKCGLSSLKPSEVATIVIFVNLSSIHLLGGLILRLADYLIKHTGARFHNTCNPLFMRKMKEMILVSCVVCCS